MLKKNRNIILDGEDSLLSLVKKFRYIIIYGAGLWGDNVYSFIKNFDKNIRVLWGVTQIEKGLIVQNKDIKEIREYFSIASQSLVILANKEKETRCKMKEYAINSGFTHIWEMKEKMVNPSMKIDYIGLIN